MEYHIAHLAYPTKNMAAALSFYTEILGFQHAFSIPMDDGPPWIEYVMTPDGRFIELFHPNGQPVSPGSDYLHLCLEVDDVAAAVAELEARGVAIRVYPSQGKDFNIQAWIRDPDGRDIELMQISPESPQHKALRRL